MDTKTAIAKLRVCIPEELNFMQQKAKERREYKEEMEEAKFFLELMENPQAKEKYLKDRVKLQQSAHELYLATQKKQPVKKDGSLDNETRNDSVNTTQSTPKQKTANNSYVCSGYAESTSFDYSVFFNNDNK